MDQSVDLFPILKEEIRIAKHLRRTRQNLPGQDEQHQRNNEVHRRISQQQNHKPAKKDQHVDRRQILQQVGTLLGQPLPFAGPLGLAKPVPVHDEDHELEENYP